MSIYYIEGKISTQSNQEQRPVPTEKITSLRYYCLWKHKGFLTYKCPYKCDCLLPMLIQAWNKGRYYSLDLEVPQSSQMCRRWLDSGVYVHQWILVVLWGADAGWVVTGGVTCNSISPSSTPPFSCCFLVVVRWHPFFCHASLPSCFCLTINHPWLETVNQNKPSSFKFHPSGYFISAIRNGWSNRCLIINTGCMPRIWSNRQKEGLVNLPTFLRIMNSFLIIFK